MQRPEKRQHRGALAHRTESELAQDSVVHRHTVVNQEPLKTRLSSMKMVDPH